MALGLACAWMPRTPSSHRSRFAFRCDFTRFCFRDLEVEEKALGGNGLSVAVVMCCMCEMWVASLGSSADVM